MSTCDKQQQKCAWDNLHHLQTPYFIGVEAVCENYRVSQEKLYTVWFIVT
jgi:hypothetical protein